MSVSHEEVLARMSPEMRAAVAVRTQELMEEMTTLRDLRTAQQLTQKCLAKILGVQQDSVSRMERRTDMLLSTMSGYVEAMGGTLRLVAEFPNRRPFTVKLSDLAEASARPTRRKAAIKSRQKAAPKSKAKPKSEMTTKTRAKAA